MRKITLQVAFASALSLWAIAALSFPVLAGDVMVMGAFARASTVPTAQTGVVYMMLMNHGTSPDRLVKVTSEAAKSVDLHNSQIVDNVAKMTAVDSLDIPAGGDVTLQPGGLHLMLNGLKAPLTKGAKINLVLTFEHAGDIAVTADVGDVAAEAHDHGSTSN
jgi:copper(I)-binding protein